MVSFIEENREKHGVEPICKTLPIAPSTYYERKVRDPDPSLEPKRTRRDEILKKEIQRIWNENRKVYGAKKVWKIFVSGPKSRQKTKRKVYISEFIRQVKCSPEIITSIST